MDMVTWYYNSPDGLNPGMYMDSKLSSRKEEGLLTWIGSSKGHMFRKLSRSLVRNFWQENVLHIFEIKKQLSGSRLMLVVFRQLFNDHSLTQIVGLLNLSKTSAMGVK